MKHTSLVSESRGGGMSYEAYIFSFRIERWGDEV